MSCLHNKAFEQFQLTFALFFFGIGLHPVKAEPTICMSRISCNDCCIHVISHMITNNQMVVSSAYISVSEFCIESGKSLMQMEKIMGPKSIPVESPAQEEAVLMFSQYDTCLRAITQVRFKPLHSVLTGEVHR